MCVCVCVLYIYNTQIMYPRIHEYLHVYTFICVKLFPNPEGFVKLDFYSKRSRYVNPFIVGGG